MEERTAVNPRALSDLLLSSAANNLFQSDKVVFFLVVQSVQDITQKKAYMECVCIGIRSGSPHLNSSSVVQVFLLAPVSFSCVGTRVFLMC